MPRALIYARYSPRPDERCESLEFQEEYCRRYFAFIGIEVAHVILDAETSARKVPLGMRRGGKQLLKLTSGSNPEFRIVGAYRLDRLWRDVVDGNVTLRAWRRSKVACHFAAEGGQSINTATATGRFIVNMLLAKAEYEPDLTSERTSSAMLRHMRNGKAMSKEPPYGTKLGPKLISGSNRSRILIPDDKELKAIQAIRERHASGQGLREIARGLNNDRVPCRGKEWRHTTVSRILAREAAEGETRP